MHDESNKIVVIIFLCLTILFLIFSESQQSVSLSNNSAANELQELDWDSIFRNQEVKAPVPKIAYIFAGSARSFVCPKEHWSIRSHLIDSFGGEAYTFIRTSHEDNLNTKTSKGKAWSYSIRHMPST